MTTELTYTGLAAALPSYCERNDTAFAEQIPLFINLAENRLAGDLKQQGFQTVVVGVFDSAATMQKPAFWRETISFSYTDADGVKHPIFLRNYEYLRAINPDITAEGPPEFYADYNFNNFLLSPIPDNAYDFELVYYARLTPLSEDNETNWLTLNAPQALLYAAIWEAQLWLKNTDKAAFWEAQYNGAKAPFMAETGERLGDRNVKVTRG